jgi:predicted aldo/keto reductase-like oxidoreductase
MSEKRVTLGNTGLTVTRFGFGGIPIQRVDEMTAVETVRHAVEQGVDFIDTSRAYTSSERKIGKALRRTNKDVVIASKSQSRTAEAVREDLETSLSELRLDRIDLYQCHFVKDNADYETVIGPNGPLDELQKARAEGLIGHIGITSHSLDLLDRILDDGLFETIMVCFSFLEPKAKEKIIPKALDKGVGVIAMKSFSGGAIDVPGPAIKYVLAQPGVVIIPGVEEKRIFDENWAVFKGDWELTREERDQIAEIRERVGKNFCRRCDYCQPCSEEIPIQLILGMRYAVKRFGPVFLEQGWIKPAIEKARNCSRCEDCLDRCPYGLPIPDLIEENLKWLDGDMEA